MASSNMTQLPLQTCWQPSQMHFTRSSMRLVDVPSQPLSGWGHRLASGAHDWIHAAQLTQGTKGGSQELPPSPPLLEAELLVPEDDAVDPPLPDELVPPAPWPSITAIPPQAPRSSPANATTEVPSLPTQVHTSQS